MRAKPNQRLNGAGFALVLIALLFRLVVPQGTMVASEAHGAALVICTGHGPMSSTDPAPGKHNTAGDCAFAAHHAGAPSAPAVAILPAPIAWIYRRSEPARATSKQAIRLAAPPPPAVGPPALQA